MKRLFGTHCNLTSIALRNIMLWLLLLLLLQVIWNSSIATYIMIRVKIAFKQWIEALLWCKCIRLSIVQEFFYQNMSFILFAQTTWLSNQLIILQYTSSQNCIRIYTTTRAVSNNLIVPSQPRCYTSGLFRLLGTMHLACRFSSWVFLICFIEFLFHENLSLHFFNIICVELRFFPAATSSALGSLLIQDSRFNFKRLEWIIGRHLRVIFCISFYL